MWLSFAQQDIRLCSRPMRRRSRVDFRSVTRDDLGRNWAVDLPKNRRAILQLCLLVHNTMNTIIRSIINHTNIGVWNHLQKLIWKYNVDIFQQLNQFCCNKTISISTVQGDAPGTWSCWDCEPFVDSRFVGIPSGRRMFAIEINGNHNLTI